MFKKVVLFGLANLCCLSAILAAAAQTKPIDAEGHPWWQHAVFYEIYPRSFADSNNDSVWTPSGSRHVSRRRRWISDMTCLTTKRLIRCTER